MTLVSSGDKFGMPSKMSASHGLSSFSSIVTVESELEITRRLVGSDITGH